MELEQLTTNEQVGGSSPPGFAKIYSGVVQSEGRLALDQET